MYGIEQKLCIILSTLEIATPLKYQKFFRLFDCPAEIWYEIKRNRAKVESVLGLNAYDKLCLALNDVYFETLLNEYEKKQINPVTYFDDCYPEVLREIADPPLTLFAKGDISLLKENCLGVVGTRKCTSYGKRATDYFVSGLVNDFCIVSGLANGIDCAAHSKALELKGKTIAVMGGGLDDIYPSNNKGLAEEIAQNGLLISEFKPNATPLPYRFPMRNRIVSGISKGLLVVEAGEKSGVFSTVDFAAEQNRDVFVVPGEIFNFASKGTNNLIKQSQNIMVTTPFDIKNFYSMRYTANKEEQNFYQVSMVEQEVINVLKTEGKTHFDVLLSKSKLSLADLNFALATLEINGFLTKLNSNNYQLNTEAEHN
jgi:DNA processing protein